MDSSGLADPFCKVNIITEYGTTKQKKWFSTKTVHKTINPEFNESVRFLGVEPEELGCATLYVVLLDDDNYGYDFLGAAKINLGLVSIKITNDIHHQQFSFTKRGSLRLHKKSRFWAKAFTYVHFASSFSFVDRCLLPR